MKAQVINKFGDPSVFELSEMAKPTLKPGHVLISGITVGGNYRLGSVIYESKINS